MKVKGNYEVVIFTLPTCIFCVELKEWLNKHSISFTEKDAGIETNSKFLQDNDVNSVPYTTITLDKEITEIVGFNPEKLKKILFKSL